LTKVVLTTAQNARSGQRAHAKTVSRVTTVSTRTVRIVAGKTNTVTTALNPAGRKLIATFKRLRVKLTLSLVVGRAHILVATRTLTITANPK